MTDACAIQFGDVSPIEKDVVLVVYQLLDNIINTYLSYRLENMCVSLRGF